MLRWFQHSIWSTEHVPNNEPSRVREVILYPRRQEPPNLRLERPWVQSVLLYRPPRLAAERVVGIDTLLRAHERERLWPG